MLAFVSSWWKWEIWELLGCTEQHTKKRWWERNAIFRINKSLSLSHFLAWQKSYWAEQSLTDIRRQLLSSIFFAEFQVAWWCPVSLQVLTRDFQPPKPAAAPLLHICNRWSLAPHEVAMVGDGEDDIICGRAAGTRELFFVCLRHESAIQDERDFSTCWVAVLVYRLWLLLYFAQIRKTGPKVTLCCWQLDSCKHLRNFYLKHRLAFTCCSLIVVVWLFSEWLFLELGWLLCRKQGCKNSLKTTVLTGKNIF